MTFETAVELVLKHEGGYVNHPQDPGGETNFGISKRAYPNVDIKNLTRLGAIQIYKRDYWDKIRGDELRDDVAIVLFDMAVNMGASQAVKLLQKALDVVQDGRLGPITIAAANKRKDIAVKLTLERIMYYAYLTRFNIFGRGWVSRSIDVMVEAT